MPELYRMEGNRLRFFPHLHQQKILDARARFLLMLAGTQGGKTSLEPLWLYREMAERGPGDYLVVGPTFQLLDKKCIPEFRRLFEHTLKVGRYVGSPGHILHVSDDGARRLFGNKYDSLTPTRILFGYANDPESLESATAKAAVLDEAGQKKFKVGAWQAIQRRLALHQGRALLATSLYAWNWLKDLTDKAAHGDPNYALVQFDSTANPSYPVEEYERARRELPGWLFEMLYRGRFERPAGLIYDCVTDKNLRRRAALPESWKRYIGLDFGAVNTAAVVVAEDPQTRVRIIEHAYKPGRRNIREHVAALKRLCPNPVRVVGGSWSEDEWRDDFAHAGLGIYPPPIKDVEVGIQRTYAEFSAGRLVLFDDLVDLRDELQTYGRELDEQGKPTDKIEDKEEYHLLDALRVLMAQLVGGTTARGVGGSAERNEDERKIRGGRF